MEMNIVFYFVDDYGLGSNMYTWDSVMNDPLRKKDFKNVMNTFLEKCSDYFTTQEDIPFPPRDDGANAFESIDYYIQKYEDPETNKYFNYFPTFTAEWPILLHLINDMPVEENEWIWQRWVNNENLITYSHYSKEGLSNPEIFCRPRKFSPLGSIIYWKEEGGICGHHSTIHKTTGAALGGPGNLLSQPGHLALFQIHHHPFETDIMEGPYYIDGHQWISGGEFNTESSRFAVTDHHQLTLSGQADYRQVNYNFEQGIVHTMNQGYEQFIKGRRVLNIFNKVDDAQKRVVLGHLVTQLEETPYHTHIWYEIADYLSGKHWTVGADGYRYSKFCRSIPDLDSYRQRLLTLAEATFRDKQIYLHVYLTTVTRIVYPAACCSVHPDYATSLNSIADSMDDWGEAYGDFVRMHYLKCEAVEGNLDQATSTVSRIYTYIIHILSCQQMTH